MISRVAILVLASIISLAQARPWDETPLKAWDETPLRAWDETPLKAWDETPLKVWDETPLKAWDETPLKAWDETPLKAWDETPLRAWDETPLKVWDETPLKAWDETPLKAWDETSLKAWDETPLRAWDETPLKAWDETPMKKQAETVITITSTTTTTTTTTTAPTGSSATKDNGLDLSASFRCGFFFAGKKGAKPKETLYIIPKLFPAACPAGEAGQSSFKNFCKLLFKKIVEKVNYETPSINATRAANGFNVGDDFCGLLKRDHGKTGLEIGFYHNSCNAKLWFDTEMRMPEGPICCHKAKFKRCKGQKGPNDV